MLQHRVLQEEATKLKILKEVEGLLVSKLDADKQTGTDAPCQAAKQFLHEAPYEQVRRQRCACICSPVICLSTAQASLQKCFDMLYHCCTVLCKQSTAHANL